MKQTILAIAGALLGGTLGYFGFFWMVSQGYYGLILPGGLLGLGASMGKTRSISLAVGFGLAALALGLFTEWRFDPFPKDKGFSYFLLHVTDKQPVTLLMIGVGGVLGFWVPFRRMEPTKQLSGSSP